MGPRTLSGENTPRRRRRVFCAEEFGRLDAGLIHNCQRVRMRLGCPLRYMVATRQRREDLEILHCLARPWPRSGPGQFYGQSKRPLGIAVHRPSRIRAVMKAGLRCVSGGVPET